MKKIIILFAILPLFFTVNCSAETDVFSAQADAVGADELEDSSDDERDTKESKDKETMWEYTTDKGKTVMGPFSGTQMEQWRSLGFFVGDSRADVRRVGETEYRSSETVPTFKH